MSSTSPKGAHATVANIAARAGRWSARHRKTAIIGWLVFVVLAFMVGGKVGTETAHRRASGVGESGQAAADPRRGLAQAGRRDGPRLEREAQDRGSRVPRGRRRRDQRLEGTKGVTRSGPLRPAGRRRPISEDGHAAMVAVRDPGRQGARPRVKASSTRRSPQTEAAQKAHPGFIVEQFGDELRGGVHGDLRRRTSQKAGDRVAADHADPPAHRLRDARRRGHPAAAGDHRRAGHDGPRRPAEPALAGRGVDQPRHPAHRPGRGRGLRAVLPAPGPRGTRRRTQHRSRPRGRGRHLRARRAGLRLDGHGRDGRHVPGRRADVHVVRDRHDRGRRRGDARLADGAARAAVEARRPHREGPHPGVWPAQATGSARVGIWSRIVDRVLRRPPLSAGLAAALLVAMAIPALGMDTGTPSTSASLPQDKPVVQTFNRVQEAFPVETSALERRRQGRGRHGAGRAGRGIAEFEQARRGAQRRCSPASTRSSTSAPTGPWPRSRWRSPATGRTTSRTGRSTCCGATSSRDARPGRRRRRPTSTARPRRTATSTTR